MQTILGSGGAIGIGLAKSLAAYTKNIRLVSRDPKKVNDTDEVLVADLTNREQVFFAVRGSEVVYLTVGLAYSTKVWQQQWPPLVQNVLDACVECRARLVFFDNVYALGRDNVRHMTEESPISPCSHKGVVRAWVDRMILDKVSKGRLLAIIARSPDFFGPIKANSALMAMVYDNLVQGKKAMWFCNARVPHTMGYTPELARAVAKLGNTSSAFNQIWNLPAAKPITGEEWVRLFADALQAKAQVQVLPKWEAGLLGLFMPVLRESYEMLYQYDQKYYFDSAKYQRVFNHSPLSNEQAVRETVEILQHATGVRR
jgi:nucleoside-diphosphate-sugar epimerase